MSRRTGTARGTSFSTIAAIRQCRSAGSSSTSTANRSPHGSHSDALCAALQIINHLQDCGKDYRNIDRVYIPLDDLLPVGSAFAIWAEPKASSGAAGLPAVVGREDEAMLPEAALLAVERHGLAAWGRNRR